MTGDLTEKVDITEGHRRNIESREELADVLRDTARNISRHPIELITGPIGSIGDAIEFISDSFWGYIDGVMSAPYSGGQ